MKTPVMAKLAFGWLLLAMGCQCHRPGELTGVHHLVAVPASLELHVPAVGASTQAAFTLRNDGRELEQVTFVAPPPFSVSPTAADLAAGEQVELTVTFAPESPGLARRTLLAASAQASATVDLAGDTLCVARDECHRSERSPSSGSCVETPAPDGTACTDACLIGAACLGGACVGTPRSCDDGNVCTLDACDRSSGCFHVDQTAGCASDACHVPACDPVSGCSTTVAPDGTDCGSNECAALVCMAGQCVSRAGPDGVSCGAASTCQPAGVCSGGVCDRPPAQPLVPLWSYAVDAGSRLWSPLMSDSSGNLHWLECSQIVPADHVSFTEDGVLRFRAPVPDVRDPGSPVMLVGDLMIAGENSAIDAVRLSDGGVVWRHDFSTELRVEPAPCAVTWPPRPYLSALADDGHGGLFAQFQSISCGGWSGAWTVKLDARTGATLWTRPYLGAWANGCSSYGSGSIFSDEAGNAFVLEGIYGCGTPAGVVSPRLSSLDPDGSVRWEQPWSLGRRPIAIFGGALDDEVGERFDAADGGLLRTVTLAGPAWGAAELLSPSGAWLIKGTIGSTSIVTVNRLDARGSMSWSRRLGPVVDGGQVGISESPILTARETLLFAATRDWASPAAVSKLFEVSADGGIAECPLPGARTDFFGQAVLLPSGKWIVVNWDAWFTVQAFQLSGVAPATTGWTSTGGSAAHANRPQ